MSMTVNDIICTAIIPKQIAGSVVQYRIQACDTLKNRLNATGNFEVRNIAEITKFNATQSTFLTGNNITVTGTSSIGNASITITYMSSKVTGSIQCTSLANGTFTASFLPNGTGTFVVQATFLGSNTFHPCSSEIIQVAINEPTFIVKYGLYIGIGLIVGLSVVSVVVYFKKYRQ
jgi:hypothetical protein